MKKIISLLMLSVSITGTTIAQEEPVISNTDKTFDVPPGTLKRRFTVDLGKGNKMQIELTDIDDLDRFSNIDSLLRIFLKDIALLKDSISDELLSKRIDYIFDQPGNNKIRIQLYKAKGSSFLVQQDGLAALKLEQDTVNFIGTRSFTSKSPLLKPYTQIGYYRLSFFVNQLSDLNNYLDAGLSEKINTIRKNENKRWIKGEDDRWHIKNGDPAIYSNHQPAGYVSGSNDYITSRVFVSVQNYKNYFVPSVSLGAAFILNNGRVKSDIGLLWEPLFFFAKDSLNKLQTFRNDFLTLTYNHSLVKKNGESKPFAYLPALSLGYLIRSKGNYFEKNTFRLGVGQASLFNDKIKIEPIFYFHDFFRGVTPGLRLSLTF